MFCFNKKKKKNEKNYLINRSESRTKESFPFFENTTSGTFLMLQYPAGASSELLPEDRGTDYAPPGTLPPNAENISSAAKDLLKRLLQPDPCLRLRSLLSLQRIAFYMGYDLQSYMQKKV